MAVALDSSPASSGRQPGILATISLTVLHGRRVVAADQHVGVDRLAEVAELLGRQVVQGGDDVAAGHGGLHVGGDAAARRDERLELVADAHEGVGHAMTTLPCSALAVLLGGRRRRVPRRGDDDEVAVGGGDVVAVRAARSVELGPASRRGCRAPPSPGTSTASR